MVVVKKINKVYYMIFQGTTRGYIFKKFSIVIIKYAYYDQFYFGWSSERCKGVVKIC